MQYAVPETRRGRNGYAPGGTSARAEKKSGLACNTTSGTTSPATTLLGARRSGGDSSGKENASLNDAEVIRYFKEVDTLPAEEKSALLRVIGGFLRDVKTKQAYAS